MFPIPKNWLTCHGREGTGRFTLHQNHRKGMLRVAATGGIFWLTCSYPWKPIGWGILMTKSLIFDRSISTRPLSSLQFPPTLLKNHRLKSAVCKFLALSWAHFLHFRSHFHTFWFVNGKYRLLTWLDRFSFCFLSQFYHHLHREHSALVSSFCTRPPFNPRRCFRLQFWLLKFIFFPVNFLVFRYPFQAFP